MPRRVRRDAAISFCRCKIGARSRGLDRAARAWHSRRMGATLHPRLLNGRTGDPGLWIEALHQPEAILLDCGDLSALAPRQLLRVGLVAVSHAHMDHWAGFDRLLRLLIGRERQRAGGRAGGLRRAAVPPAAGLYLEPGRPHPGRAGLRGDRGRAGPRPGRARPLPPGGGLPRRAAAAATRRGGWHGAATRAAAAARRGAGPRHAEPRLRGGGSGACECLAHPAGGARPADRPLAGGAEGGGAGRRAGRNADPAAATARRRSRSARCATWSR